MNRKNQRVVRAMGSRYEQFRFWSKQIQDDPRNRLTYEQEVTKILEQMTALERLELRAALQAALEKR